MRSRKFALDETRCLRLGTAKKIEPVWKKLTKALRRAGLWTDDYMAIPTSLSSPSTSDS
jgi:hypothetical protein